MRPQRTQQNPTPFARKWPRQRRQAEKGPSVKIKTLTLSGCPMNPRDAAMELRALVLAECPKGWDIKDSARTFNQLTGVATATVTYKRPTPTH